MASGSEPGAARILVEVMRIKRTAIAEPELTQQVCACGRRFLAWEPGPCAVCTTPGRNGAAALLRVRTCQRCGETFGDELEHCPICPQFEVEHGIFRTKASDAIHVAQLVGDRGVTRCGFTFHRGDPRFGWGIWSEEFCEFLGEEFGIYVRLCSRCPDCRPPKGWIEGG